MLKVLLKKQLMEVFRNYFYDAKKNTGRAKGSTIAYFVLFAVIMFGMLGSMFTSMSLKLCGPLTAQGMDWLYFCVTGLLSLVLGTFGSVFSTFAGLYLSKDNDLLLSMPIPVRYIMAARLLNVYLMGLLYSAIVLVPALIVYWTHTPVRAAAFAGGIVLLASISLLTLVLSCLLGWIIAKISLKLKNKSVISALLGVAFIAVYYFFYFKAQTLLRTLTENAAEYGARIRGSAYALYLFGAVGAGSVKAMLLCGITAAVLFAATWVLLQRSFLRIVTATPSASKAVYREKAVRKKSVSEALLLKELRRFLASPNYMLNCGLGIVFLPAAGIAILIKGTALLPTLSNTLATVFEDESASLAALLGGAVCMVSSMNNISAPSVSLEGRNLWIIRSLPVAPVQVLQAKVRLHILLSGIPMLFCAICAAAILPIPIAAKLLFVLLSLLCVVLEALWGLHMGLVKPDLAWTNETAPVKQNIYVAFSIFGMWLYAVFLSGALLAGVQLVGVVASFGVMCVVTAGLCGILYRRLKTKGAKKFAEL